MIPAYAVPAALLSAHEEKFSRWIGRWVEEKKIHPTLLITGVEGVGKKSMAKALIHRIFCDQSQQKSLEPCGTCPSCQRAKQNQWIDLHWFDPDQGEDDTRLGIHKIDPFRELKMKLGLGPSDEPFKIVVIPEADRMTPQAANSILKTLEEPPKNWLFILTAADSSRLLPTVLSRCIEIKLRPLKSEEIFTILQQVQGPEFQSNRARMASRASEGSLARALSFLDDETWKVRDQILGLLSNPAAEWMSLIDQIASNRKNFQTYLDLVESILMDLLRSSLDPNYSWIHEDQKEFLQQWMESKRLSTAEILHALSQISDKRKFLPLTLNSKILAQESLIPLLETLIS